MSVLSRVLRRYKAEKASENQKTDIKDQTKTDEADASNPSRIYSSIPDTASNARPLTRNMTEKEAAKKMAKKVTAIPRTMRLTVKRVQSDQATLKPANDDILALNDPEMQRKLDRTLEKLRVTKERLEFINEQLELSKKAGTINRTIH